MVGLKGKERSFSASEKYVMEFLRSNGYKAIIKQKDRIKTVFEIEKDGVSEDFCLGVKAKKSFYKGALEQTLQNIEVKRELQKLRKEIANNL